MSLSTGLRLTTRRLNTGQARVVAGGREARQFSYYASISRSSRRPGLPSDRLRSLQQTRSLSLFGWGSSKSSTDFGQAHPSSSLSEFSSTATLSEPIVESARTVKASHSTSDVPDPTKSSSIEADALLPPENTVSALPSSPGDIPDLASIPEGLGYLKDVCGLDFGWGPTSVMQFVLEHIHVTGGVSWAVSVMGLAFVLRAALYPWSATASDMAARFQEFSPLIKEIQLKSQAAVKNNDKAGVLEAQMQVREMKKDSKLSFFKMLRPILIQLPLGYGAWHLLGTASRLPVPAFEHEQWLWLSNLAITDPLYILPLVTAAMTWLNLQTSAKSQTDSAALPGMAMLRHIFPVLTGAFLMYQPACVQLYFLASVFFTQIQMSSFQSPGFRRLLKMYPLPVKGVPGANKAFSHMNTSPNVINTTAKTIPSITSYNLTPTSSSKPAPAPAPAAQRSMIDKGVDSIKASTQDVWNKAMGSTYKKRDEKVAEQKEQAQKNAAARYAAQRKVDLENSRSYRNAVRSKPKPNSK